MKWQAFFLVTSFGVLVACGPPPVKHPNSGPPGPFVAPTHIYKFSVHKVQDPANNNMVAYTYLLPDGWTPGDKIQWQYGKLPYPVALLTASSPDKSHKLGFTPMLVGTGWNAPGGPGGMTFTGSSEAIEKLVGKNPSITNFHVLSEFTAPAQSNYPAMQGGVPTADVTIKQCQYSEDGVPREALLIGKLDMFNSKDQFSTSQLWNFSLQVMAAPPGRLMSDPEFIRQASMFLGSAQITAEFNAVVNQIAFDASQTQRKIALQQDDKIMKDYWDRQKSQDRSAENFDNYIRDRQNFTGPDGKTYSLPSTLNHWMDGNGNFYSSDDPNYDPNGQGGGGGFQQLKQSPGG